MCAEDTVEDVLRDVDDWEEQFVDFSEEAEEEKTHDDEIKETNLQWRQECWVRVWSVVDKIDRWKCCEERGVVDEIEFLVFRES